MHIVVILATLLAIIGVVHLFFRKLPPPEMEEILHLTSTDELKLAHVATSSIRGNLIDVAHFNFHGQKIDCGYGFHKQLDQFRIELISIEFVEIILIEDQRGLIIEFEDGRSKKWEGVPNGSTYVPINEHQRWVLEQILAIVQNAASVAIQKTASTAIQGALS